MEIDGRIVVLGVFCILLFGFVQWTLYGDTQTKIQNQKLEQQITSLETSNHFLYKELQNERT